MRDFLRNLEALAAYSALPLTGYLLVSIWGGWPSVALLWLNLAVQIGLLLVFSIFPWPARRGTLRRMDYAAMAWLPHVAVTRLTESHLEGRVSTRWRLRIFLAALLMWGTPLPVVTALVGEFGPLSPVAWASYCPLMLAGFLVLALYGRERGAASGPLQTGTDIG